MTSMRTLRRRLLRWQRYAARINYHLGDPEDDRMIGYDRAELAVEIEQQMRRYRTCYWPVVVTVPVDRGLL